jgi:CRP-like cAMP-binding protein
MAMLDSLMSVLPFFRGMSPENLAQIAGCATNVRYQAGELLGRIGDPADHFWVIRQGRVALEIHIPGRRPMTISTQGPGDIVGFSWLVPPHELRFDIHVMEATRALRFDGVCLRGKCATDPLLGYELLTRFSRILVERLEASTLQLLDMYGDPAEQND